MSWFIPIDKLCPPEHVLDPDIRSILDTRIDGNICISGFVKTGKTIAMLYLTKKLLVKNPDSKILFLAFSNTLAEMFKEAFRIVGIRANIETFWKFKNNQAHYDYIICDDVNLMGPSLLNEVKDRANIVIVSINPYLTFFDEIPLTKENPVTLDQVKEILSPKVFELQIVHHAFSMELAKMFLYDNIEFKYPISKIDSSFQLCEASSKIEEVKFVINQSHRPLIRGYSSAILLPTRKSIVSFIQSIIKLKGEEPWKETFDIFGRLDLSDLNKYLSSKKLNYQFLGSGYGKYEDIENKVTFLTYFGAIGLEFDYVYMPCLNRYLFIHHNEQISKTHFAYALTRSRMTHYLVYNGFMHDYLQRIKDHGVPYYRLIQDDNENKTTSTEI